MALDPDPTISSRSGEDCALPLVCAAIAPAPITPAPSSCTNRRRLVGPAFVSLVGNSCSVGVPLRFTMPRYGQLTPIIRFCAIALVTTVFAPDRSRMGGGVTRIVTGRLPTAPSRASVAGYISPVTRRTVGGGRIRPSAVITAYDRSPCRTRATRTAPLCPSACRSGGHPRASTPGAVGCANPAWTAGWAGQGPRPSRRSDRRHRRKRSLP